MIKRDFSRRMVIQRRRVRSVPRRPFSGALFLGLFLLLGCSFGCAPSSQSDREGNSPASESGDSLEITEAMIKERINGTRIRKVPEENETAAPITWTFDEDEPKEIRVVEKQSEGTRAIIVLDITTKSAANSREPRSLAGQIRTEWELQTGWVLRKWEIVKTENISMKYKNLPKPPAQNSAR